MIEHSLVGRGIDDEPILAAFARIPRELFMPEQSFDIAYADFPVPIGRGQTISQPYIVAHMLQELELRPDVTVLEVGSGSGYVIALLSLLCRSVHGVERISELSERSRSVLGNLMRGGVIRNNFTIIDSGDLLGCPDSAPFDRILVSAAAPEVPPELFAQLAEGGVMIMPVGDDEQWLEKIMKVKGRMVREELLPVKFVPLVL